MLPSEECKIKSESTSFKLGQSIFMHLWVFKYTKSFSFLFRGSKGKEYNALYAILQKAYVIHTTHSSIIINSVLETFPI